MKGAYVCPTPPNEAPKESRDAKVEVFNVEGEVPIEKGESAKVPEGENVSDVTASPPIFLALYL